MTIRCSIASKEDPRAFLRRGINSMFAAGTNQEETAPPVDTGSDRKKLPAPTPTAK
ncbi:MAG: hypothetical protein KUA35_12500 [Pseudodesulfovibrio sp.]|uniref:Uncharacterized protein n=1 Tax=Pseudodesulfovibrio aespoeensis (strain ATCC 700646 / DSM 10631 / Aspo-2) TaxID=643562 RepID=E6VZS4_PSEA9|nr:MULTISPECIES: hypothetical protein [Pseudodesulfovibrio]MBU4192406.1 hypothetical protein [Pseudomonadota bacterium]ADU62902.1 hypothetical protein Daes_1893 [Pseudodesulfovibrio aespoeensis Aspo-2]MBU4244989.1 hypothetical protein [Pseudomonadota bacterium]MBU4476519.1 hypothetical protein [Pseudomonadota bacterium]MBU4514624.1 hypothetical protein [Pseudomonadota bacterium]